MQIIILLIEWCIIMCGLTIYTRLEHFNDNLLQKLFPEFVYFQKSNEHAIFLPHSKCFYVSFEWATDIHKCWKVNVDVCVNWMCER